MNLELITRMMYNTQQQQILLPKGVSIRGPAGDHYAVAGTVPVDAISRVTRRKDKGVDPLKSANLLESTIPTVVDQALQRAMSISSADRFESIEEFGRC